MLFIPQKMNVQMEDGNIVEFDFNNTESIIVDTSVPLTTEQQMELVFKAGVFIGGGNKALSQFD